MCHFRWQKHPETFITHTGCNKDKVASSATAANSWFIGWYDRFDRQGVREREGENSGPSKWAGGMTVQQKQLVQKETGSLCCHQNISYATVTADNAVRLCSNATPVPPETQFAIQHIVPQNNWNLSSVQQTHKSSYNCRQLTLSSPGIFSLWNNFLTRNAKIPVGDMSMKVVIHPGHLDVE